MTIQLATDKDAEAIASVLREAFEEFRPLYTSAGFRATTPSAQEIARRFVEGPVWIVTDSGAVIGTVSGVLHRDELYVRSMAVIPRGRGKSIGLRLLRAVEEFAISREARRLRLRTTPFLLSAIRLYERAGFVRLPEGADLHGTPLLVMVKDLNGLIGAATANQV